MFNKDEIIEILEDNDLDNVKEIKKHDECFIVKFSYEFDDLELEGAREYADEECEDEKEGEEWYQEYLLPYLNDMAIDNINDIIDEIADDYSLDYEMLSFELSEDSYEEMSFLVAFYRKNLPISIDDLILEL
ncbi:MAG: hypothetical protein E6344_15970 [Clostridium sp.]|nr:hypothetical protein [Clostridium sp.]MDU7085190.1 hypothetical protein [Clostridium sp.]